MARAKKKVKYGQGQRHNVFILARHKQIWKEIENKSNFLQLCLDNASDIMAWGILRDIDPKKYKITHKQSDEEIMTEFNKKNPTNELTAKRQHKKWQKNSPTLPGILS